MAAPQDHVFHFFPRLPPELRLAIWHECLPHRVVELQTPNPYDTYGIQSRTPCRLAAATYKNTRPPVLSRVCQESRAVAFETGSILRLGDPDDSDGPEEQSLKSTAIRHLWLDTARDSVHMNYEGGFIQHDDAIRYDRPALDAYELAMRTARNGVSFNVGFLIGPPPFAAEVLWLRESWVVVICIAVIHMDFAAAATTGLFGHLGDAPVQVVDAHDNERITAFNNLAIVNAGNGFPSNGECVKEDILRVRAKKLIMSLTPQLFRGKEKEGVSNPELKPAAMFRLCTDGCDHSTRDLE